MGWRKQEGWRRQLAAADGERPAAVAEVGGGGGWRRQLAAVDGERPAAVEEVGCGDRRWRPRVAAAADRIGLGSTCD